MSFNKCKNPKAKSWYQNFVDFNAENRCYQLIDMRAVVSKILHTETHVLLKKPGTWIILLNQIRFLRVLLSKKLPWVPTVFTSGGKMRVSHNVLLILVLLCYSSTQPPSGKRLLEKRVPMYNKPYCFRQILQANSDTWIPWPNISPVFCQLIYMYCRSQSPRGLRRRSAASCLLRSWFESYRGHGYLSVVSVVCCQVEVSATSLITRPEESYRLWCVIVCDLETSKMRRPWPALSRSTTATKKKKIYIYIHTHTHILAAYTLPMRTSV